MQFIIKRPSNMIAVILLLVTALFAAFLSYTHFFKNRFDFQEISKQPSLKKCDSGLSRQIKGGRKFSKHLVNSYLNTLANVVHTSFKESFLFWGREGISARILFSTFAETLIYIYPNDKSEMILDCTHLPAQMVFFYDLINLKDPKYPIYDNLIKVTVDKEKAVKTWLETPSRMIAPSNGSGYFAGSGTVRFENPYRVISFDKNGFMTFFKGNIEVERDVRDSLHEKVYMSQKPHSFSFQIDGALIFAGEKDLSGLRDIALQIGTQLAEIEIKDLIASSEFFRESLAHEELSAGAQKIIEKRKRAETERSTFKYPLWEYLKDIEHLKQRAPEFGVNASYIDELLLDRALEPNSGYFFGLYYPDQFRFSCFWTMLNLILLLLLAVGKRRWPSAFSYLRTKFSISGTVLAINSYVYLYQRPEYLGFLYLVVPGLLLICCIILPLIWKCCMNTEPKY